MIKEIKSLASSADIYLLSAIAELMPIPKRSSIKDMKAIQNFFIKNSLQISTKYSCKHTYPHYLKFYHNFCTKSIPKSVF